MLQKSIHSILLLQLCFVAGLHANDDELPPVIHKQINHVVTAYRDGAPFRFTQHSSSLIKKVKPEQLELINKRLTQQKLPHLQEMMGEVRLRSIMANVNLPKMNWQELTAVLPVLIEQVAILKDRFEASEFYREATPPEDLPDYDEKFWQLHVFRNQFNALAKTATHVNATSSFYKRQILDAKKSNSGDKSSAFDKLPKLAGELYAMRNLVDEREAELRVHRTTEAESNVDLGQEFKTRLDAAFALADDRLFFEQFFDTVKREDRKLVNQDLNDESILKMVAETSTNAKKKHGPLFDKATLLYSGAHWWLRGRYGRGPLANGLLKSEDAANSEKQLFPLLMPVKMPTPEQLVGDKAPFQPVRRHNYVWILGVDRFNSSGLQMVQNTVNREVKKQEGKGEKPYKAKIQFNRFY